MDMSYSFQPQLQQKLSLTPAMLHSLQILRAPLAELQEVLLPIVYENPLLEMREPVSESSADFPERPLSVSFSYEESEANAFHGSAEVHGTDYAALVKREQTFQEMLEEQLLGLPLTEQMHMLCRYIIQNLNRRGYLDIPTAALAQELSLDESVVMQAVYAVQMLHPAGVGARTLSECLLLQLAQTHHFCKETVTLISRGLPYLARNDKKSIARLLDCDAETAERACAVVLALNPSPASGYETGEDSGTVVPDAYIREEYDGFSVCMNGRGIPQLTLSQDYLALLRKTTDEQLHAYLRSNLNQAKSVLQALDGRTQTLSRILTCILRRQVDYFRQRGPLLPMRMSQIAEELDLHISTVSRAVQNKYIHCNFGTIAIKDLFGGGIESSGGSVQTPDAVCMRLRQCIAAEDPAAPLSDEALRIALKGYGIDLSRRTIAKYRESMSIPSSRLRSGALRGCHVK